MSTFPNGSDLAFCSFVGGAIAFFIRCTIETDYQEMRWWKKIGLLYLIPIGMAILFFGLLGVIRG